MINKPQLLHRDLSWLSFNERVLQEAQDKNVPLLERIRFLGIFSNNRDEFFRVRVATLRRMKELQKKSNSYLQEISFNPKDILHQVQKINHSQERLFQKCYDNLIKELQSENIHIVDEKSLSKPQGRFVMDYFEEKVRTFLVPIILDKRKKFPRLKDKTIYLAIKLYNPNDKEHPLFAIIEIPQNLPRFLNLPEKKDKISIILLDDVIRYNLMDVFALFNYECIESYTFKITKDAELDLDNDLSTSLLEKMEKSIKRRKKAVAVRFVYDADMPEDLFTYLVRFMKLKDNIISSGRYHNFKDFIRFPDIINNSSLKYEELPPLPHPQLSKRNSIFQLISQQDIFLAYPFQSFHYIIDLLREAAIDPHVESIKINLYRVAYDSKIINALLNAARNQKKVTVIIELKARFDEENNIFWSSKLEDAGIKVTFGVSGLKVHSKLILITKIVNDKKLMYAHIGTGNFHEGTAKIYGDYSLLTSEGKITREVEKIFDFFNAPYKQMTFRHLFVSPYTTRKKFINLINSEIRSAKKGNKASITLKLNNLTDEVIIQKLFEAANSGVKIKLIIRGICSLVLDDSEASQNIEIISIVDRFLEHVRLAIFHNHGQPLYFISSADWMIRNLDHRIEVTAPVWDDRIKKIIDEMIDLQLKDNVKARVLGKNQNNNYKINKKEPIRSQIATYNYFKSKV